MYIQEKANKVVVIYRWQCTYNRRASKVVVMYRWNSTYLQGVRERRCRLTRAILRHPAGMIMEDIEGLRWAGTRRDEGLDGRKRRGAGEKTGE